MSHKKEITVTYDWSENVKIKVRCKSNRSFGIIEVTLLKFKSSILSMELLGRLNELIFHKVIGRDIRIIEEVIIDELNLRKNNFETYGEF